jgi:hypothetical protein
MPHYSNPRGPSHIRDKPMPCCCLSEVNWDEFKVGLRLYSKCTGVIFCAEAWHLQRRGVARNFGGALNLQQGSRAHRDIGSRVDRVRGLERMRRVVLLVVAALLAELLFQLLSPGGPLRP